MGELRPWHIVVLVVLLILLFGAKRLPDGARALGRSLRIFKAETEGLLGRDGREDDSGRATADPPRKREPVDSSRVEPESEPPELR
jgi:sec-independent protein translocase protein TatA